MKYKMKVDQTLCSNAFCTMSSPFRSQHLFIPNSKKSKKPVSTTDISFSIPSSQDYIDFDHEYDSEHSTDDHLFDINDMEYEAAKKEYESKGIKSSSYKRHNLVLTSNKSIVGKSSKHL